MTISSNDRIAQYTGNGTSTFSFQFKVFQASDLLVVKQDAITGTETTLTLTTDYTVTLNADQNYNPGGNVITTSAVAVNYNLTITSNIENLQPTDLSNQGGFYPDVINDSLDRATIQIQQLSDLTARSMVAPVSDGITNNLELPSATVRASKYLAFDASGVPVAAAGTGSGTGSNTSPSNLTLTANNGGSNVGRDVIFYDNATETMRVKGSGTTSQVGIGTATPANKLQVDHTSTTADGIQIRSLNSTAYAQILPAGQTGVPASGVAANSVLIEGVPASTAPTAISSYANSLVFQTNARTERMRIDSAGLVGIGTNSPGSTLDVSGGQIRVRSTGSYSEPNVSVGALYYDATSGNFTIDSRSSGANSAMSFRTSSSGTGAERIGISSAGAVNVGTSTTAGKLTVYGTSATGTSINDGSIISSANNPQQLNVGVSSANGNAWLQAWNTGSGGFGIPIALNPGGATVGIGMTATPNRPLTVYKSTTPALQLCNSTTGTGVDNGGIVSVNGVTMSVNCLEATGILTLGTGGVTRQTFDASGNTGFGITPAAFFHVNGTIRYTNRPAAGTITAMGWDTNGDLKASSSSLRYKHDVQNYQRGLADIAALRPVTFKFNGEDRQNAGFIAEEIDALGMNELMLYDDQGRPDGVLYANMVAMLTKGIQELKAVVDAQAARIAALEATP